MQKIVIIGAGRVGESTAQFLAIKDAAHDIVLIDIKEGQAEGAALDIQQTAPLLGFDSRVQGSTRPETMQDAELVIITAGIPRKPGMSRSDVLDTNVKILDAIIDDVLKYAPDASILVVSNPVDVLTWRAWQRTGWSRERVFGQAGVLDSTRMAAFIAIETGLSTNDIQTMVLGGHGDAMVPMTRYTTISGISIEQFLAADKIEEIIERTRNGGAEVLGLRQSSSAYDAPAAATAVMVDAIVHDRKRILPTVTILEGEYGYEDAAMGVPCVLGRGGMEKIIGLELTPEESTQFKTSMNAVLKDIARLK